MQSVSSRIWTRVAVSISYEDNHYTTGTSTILYPAADCFLTNRKDAAKGPEAQQNYSS